MKQKDTQIISILQRRRFLKILGAGAALGIPVGWGCSSDSDLIIPDPNGSLSLTPAQAEGPFYPVPSIEQQLFNDTDLTRKLPQDEIATGQLIVIEGTVMDQNQRPLNQSIVEIWQASTAGHYNHPNDAANDPALDQAFQFWGRAITGEDGTYQFTTILPGEYTGRSARHIHFRIDAPGYNRLTTQSYFASFGSRNASDSLYNSLSSSERALVTVEFEEFSDQPWSGTFNIVLQEA